MVSLVLLRRRAAISSPLLQPVCNVTFRKWTMLCNALLSTSAVVQKDKDEYKRIAEARRRALEANWSKYKRHNVFKWNEGMSRGLKALDVDSEDVMAKDYNVASSYSDPHSDIETALEGSERHDRLMHQGKLYKQKMDTQTLSKLLTKKRFFPDPKPPSLLTWMEKEMIRLLHNSDKEAYSPLKLADHFPATPKIIAKVLKSRPTVYKTAADIEEHDKLVRDNWRLLAKGKLQVDKELEEHLRGMGDLRRAFSSQQRNKMTEMILEANEERRKQVPKPKIGAIGAIVADYNRKREALRQSQEGLESRSSSSNTVDIKTNVALFSDSSEYNPMLDGANVYKDTSLLASPIKLKNEPRITMEEFRKQYMNHLRSEDSERKPSAKVLKTKTIVPFEFRPKRMGDEQAKRLFKQWLAKEEAKENRERRLEVDVNVVLKELEEERRGNVDNINRKRREIYQK